MPLISPSAYDPPLPFKSGHLQTVYPTLFRKVNGLAFRRERIETPDGDFLDLDWAGGGGRRLAILSHGLEGSSERSYMRGMARTLCRHGWDALAWNYRGCSGEPNRRLRSYHSGATDDLDVVVQHALRQRGDGQVALVGFSLGGNLTLKYVGERGDGLDPRISAAVAFSAPCDLAAGVAHLQRPGAWFYHRRFLTALREKIRRKEALFPEALDVAGLDEVATLRDFDERYTAPIHGFQDAADYYARSSSARFIPDIRIPTLLLSSADDPFLPAACYPLDAARKHPHFHLEMPSHGGHVGFVAFNEAGAYWSEQRAAAFLDDAAQTASASK